MTDFRCKLVTLVTEAILEIEICEALDTLGATGYTVVDARGSGSRGIRNAGWQSSSNIRIEVLCSAELAKRIEEYMQKFYYENYAMVLFEADVSVLRPDKFS
jgi:hypothetical protein